MNDGSTEPYSLDMLPYEVQAMILRYAMIDILHELRRTNTNVSFTARLRQWLCLRLTSKTFENVLSQLIFEGEPLLMMLKRKQLEKLDYTLEAIQLTADLPPINSLISLPKMKRLCGRFWHNPDLSAETVRTLLSVLQSPHSLNLAVKLESWILRHAKQSEGSSTSGDDTLFFERGDWMVDAGDLQIRRVSRWSSAPRSRLGMYLTQEYGQPLTPVHARLGHDRRWYMEYRNEVGQEVMKCMVNYKTKMVWDHLVRRLYDFEGRQYQFEGSDDDVDTGGEDESSSDDEDLQDE
jgi:hypothetical protein